MDTVPIPKIQQEHAALLARIRALREKCDALTRKKAPPR